MDEPVYVTPSTGSDGVVAIPPPSSALTTTGTRALVAAGDLAARGLDLVALLEAGLPPAAIAVTRTRPPAWESLVFAHVLCAEVEAVRSLRVSAFSVSVATTGEAMPETALAAWVKDRTDEYALNRGAAFGLIKELMRETMKTPADLVQVAAGARSVAACYRYMLEWKRHVRETNFPPRCRPVQEAIAACCDGNIEQVEEFGKYTIALIASLTARDAAGEIWPANQVLTLNLSLEEFASERVERAWAQMAER